MSKKNDLEHTSTMLGSQNMKSSQRMVSVVEPYELPEGWKWCRLPECVSIVTGKKDANYGTPDGKYLFFTCAEQPLRCDDYSFEGESLLLPGNGANVGQVIYYDGQFEVYQRTYVLQKTNESILLKYLYYHILGFWKNYNLDKQYGSATNYIKMGNFLNYPFPLPPTLAEQQRIVNRIESMFAKLDEAKEKAQNVVDGFETRKAAILHKAFTGELKIENEKLKEEDWEETTLSECCKLGSGGTPSKSHPEYYENGDIPWLKTGEIDWNDIYDAEEKITDDGVANSSAKMFPAESVVVAMYGMGVTRGRAAIIKKPMTTNQAVCVLQPKEKLYNKFLFYYFMCNYHKIREQSVGGNQLNLSGKIIGNFPIKLPPFNFQLSIVNFLDIIIEKENKAKQAAEAVLEQIDLLKKSILARAFRGEL